MKIMVTGCAGLIGSWVAEALANAGHDVIGVDDLSGGYASNIDALPRSVVFESIDLCNREAISRACTQHRPEVVYHFASCAREGASQFQPAEVTSRNLMATVSLLEAAIPNGMRQIIYASSMARYGDQVAPFHEELSAGPVDVYGVNKWACERTIQILASVHGFDWTILVPHNVFGPRQIFDLYRNVAAIFMNRIMRGEPIYIYGDGEQRRAFSYIVDSLPCYLNCLDGRANGQIVNIGGKVEISINILARAVIEDMGAAATARIEHLPDRPCEVKDAWCSWQKSVDLLGYEEKVGWREGLKKMAQWAIGMGPQEWRFDDLPLLNDKAPSTWKQPVSAELGA